MHTALASPVRLSESHVRSLSQQVSLPLLACHERQHHEHLAQIAKEQGGLMMALDGLAPQGGAPHMWCIRARTSGMTWRRGWLAQQDHTPFEGFLAPLRHLEWPILAVLSDKHTGLVPAVATVLPTSRSQFCQAHDLRHLAEPLAEAEATLKGALRQTVRQQVGNVLRQEPHTGPSHASVLPVTGLLPRPLGPQEEPTAPDAHSQAPSASPTAPAREADAVITPRFRPTRSLRTLKGRAPFRLAGLATYERLQNVARFSLDLLATRYDPRLVQLVQGLQAAFAPFTKTYQALQQGAAWLRDLADILEPTTTQAMQGEQVAEHLRGDLDTVRRLPEITPALSGFGLHLDTVSRRSWPGLFHGSEVPGLPRTNNALDSRFLDTRRRLLRTTGHKGLSQRTLPRQGAWELLPRPPTETQ